MHLDIIATTVSESVGVVVAGVSIVVAIVLYFRAKLKKAEQTQDDNLAASAISSLQATVSALKEQNTIQAGQITAQGLKISDQDKKVATLSGTVDTLKNIPLAKIEQHMADTNQILQALIPLIPQSIDQLFSGTKDKGKLN
jgi:hypothetical protein